jgi:hypothetical protein
MFRSQPADVNMGSVPDQPVNVLSGIQDFPIIPTGIPVRSVDEIIAIYAHIIENTFEESGLDKYEDFEKLYIDIIKNFITFAHLVPASENNHHIRAGGLVEHSLEVAFYSMRNAGLSILPHIGHCDFETKYRQPRWRYAAWLTGLLHDAGKPYTDFTVVSDKGDKWQPLVQPLYDWCINNQVKSYHCVWHVGRTHKEHDHITLTSSQTILTDFVRRYISESTDNLWAQIAMALSSYNKREGYIDSSVRRADYESTEKDSRRTIDKMMGDRAAPIQAHLIMAMRSLRQRWTANKQNSQIWIISSEVYLLWPICIESMISLAQERGHKVPSDPNVALEIMESRGYIDKPEDGSSFMLFQPEKIPAGKLRVIRLSSPGHLYEGEPIPGNVPGILRLATEPDPPPQVVMPDLDSVSSADSVNTLAKVPNKSADSASQKKPKVDGSNTDRHKQQQLPLESDETKGAKGKSKDTKGIIFKNTPCEEMGGERPDKITLQELSEYMDSESENPSKSNNTKLKKIGVKEGDELDVAEHLVRSIVYSLSTGETQIGMRHDIFTQEGKLALKWPTMLFSNVVPPKGMPTELMELGYIESSGNGPVHRKSIAGKKQSYLLFSKKLSEKICITAGLESKTVLAIRKKARKKVEAKNPIAPPAEAIEVDRHASDAKESEQTSQATTTAMIETDTSQLKEKTLNKRVWDICNQVSHEGVVFKWINENSEIVIATKLLRRELESTGSKLQPKEFRDFTRTATTNTKLGNEMALIFSREVFNGI